MAAKFEPGQQYKRLQIAEIAGKPIEGRGGPWFTGYDEWNGQGFVFANVGEAGRVGVNYGNQWIGGLLDWSGRTSSRRGQPLIERIVSNQQVVHIFWREGDRSPFTYAGPGTAMRVAEGPPVRVLWTFEEGKDSSNVSGNKQHDVWRRGPPPRYGNAEVVREDGPTFVYLVQLSGPVVGTFTHKARHTVIKIGMSNDLRRRLSELNYGFPPGSPFQWELVRSRRFQHGLTAWVEEGKILDQLRSHGFWTGLEYAEVPLEFQNGILR